MEQWIKGHHIRFRCSTPFFFLHAWSPVSSNMTGQELNWAEKSGADHQRVKVGFLIIIVASSVFGWPLAQSPHLVPNNGAKCGPWWTLLSAAVSAQQSSLLLLLYNRQSSLLFLLYCFYRQRLADLRAATSHRSAARGSHDTHTHFV